MSNTEISNRNLKGKVAIVTASTDGIGRAIARRLGQEGVKVMISSRKQKNVDGTVKSFRDEGITAEGCVCHVAKADHRQLLVDLTLEKFGKIDILVSNAGINPSFGSLLDVPEETWDKTLLLLSHGNATVEGGFSVNGDILVENLVERSVVAQRTIFDALRMAGGALSINIDKEMLVKVRSSHSALKDHMEKMRKAEKEGLKGTEQRKRDLLLLKEKEAKKRKLQEEFEKASADVVALQKKVCEKR